MSAGLQRGEHLRRARDGCHRAEAFGRQRGGDRRLAPGTLEVVAGDQARDEGAAARCHGVAARSPSSVRRMNITMA